MTFNFIISTLMVFAVTLALDCKIGQKQRKDTSGNTICCFTVICNTSQGFTLCKKDQGYDSCYDCGPDQFTLDKINTVDAEGETSVCQNIPKCDTKSKYLSTISYQCLCDRSKGYYGDPDNCRKAQYDCNFAGYELKNEGNCDNCGMEMYKSSNDNSLCKAKTKCKENEIETDSGSIKSDRVCTEITTISTQAPTSPTKDLDYKDNTSKWTIYIVCSVAVCVLILLPMIVGYYFFCYKRRRCKAFRKETKPDDGNLSESDPEKNPLIESRPGSDDSGNLYFDKRKNNGNSSNNTGGNETSKQGNLVHIDVVDETSTSASQLDESLTPVKFGESRKLPMTQNSSTSNSLNSKAKCSQAGDLNSKENNAMWPSSKHSDCSRQDDLNACQTGNKNSVEIVGDETEKDKHEYNKLSEEREQTLRKIGFENHEGFDNLSGSESKDLTDCTDVKCVENSNPDKDTGIETGADIGVITPCEVTPPQPGPVTTGREEYNMPHLNLLSVELSECGNSGEIEDPTKNSTREVDNTFQTKRNKQIKLPEASGQIDGLPVGHAIPIRSSSTASNGNAPLIHQISTQADMLNNPTSQNGDEVAQALNNENYKAVYNSRRPTVLNEFPETFVEHVTPIEREDEEGLLNQEEGSDDNVEAVVEQPTNPNCAEVARGSSSTPSLPVLSQQPESANFPGPEQENVINQAQGQQNQSFASGREESDSNSVQRETTNTRTALSIERDVSGVAPSFPQHENQENEEIAHQDPAQEMHIITNSPISEGGNPLASPVSEESTQRRQFPF